MLARKSLTVVFFYVARPFVRLPVRRSSVSAKRPDHRQETFSAALPFRHRRSWLLIVSNTHHCKRHRGSRSLQTKSTLRYECCAMDLLLVSVKVQSCRI